jgi:hypothetical protein
MGQSGATDRKRYIVVEVHDSGARIQVWSGRGEKDAIREAARLNWREGTSSIHYIVEDA